MRRSPVLLAAAGALACADEFTPSPSSAGLDEYPAVHGPWIYPEHHRCVADQEWDF